jgi:FAD/FMN-containing dehydrogenase
MMTLAPDVLAALRRAVGAGDVVTDPAVVASYATDWTGRFVGAAPAVVRPRDVDAVAAVVRCCADAGIPIVPQGGNTGLVGGSVPLHGEIVLSMRHLDALGPVDARAAQVTAQAGVTLGRLQQHARDAGWDYGVDLAARDSATVGGTVATNAGGVQVLRYGSTRRQVVGIQAVLGDGSVIDRLDGLEKDNTGYDLAGLLCGSEGTLGVVTAARLRLVPRLAHVVVALLAFDEIDGAIAAVGALRRELDALRALELFLQDGLDLVCGTLDLAPPFATRHTAYVLVECASSGDPTDALAHAVAQLPAVGDAAVATDATMARALWRYREGHTEAINQLGPPHKLDVTLPADQLAPFVDQVRDVVGAVTLDARVWLFGHAGDGNVHVNVTGVAPDDDRVTDAVLMLVASLHGSISAEHGVGTAKRAWLHLVRTPAELAAYASIKRALDPRGILNAHVLLTPP